ncbi:hypothetical protein F5B19DRAFT_464158 [Rostrohypoxylon terebratum]|nr:hypothetical protein F5B19DRAFT_464158 [Rostrohypoxylon terebratum]
MAKGLANTWWHRNHLVCVNYPDLPTKKEVIYRVFRAAYPDGAFVDDDLRLVELRDKEIVWQNLTNEMDQALGDVDAFVNTLPAQVPRLRNNASSLDSVREYYKALMQEAKQALFVSQNGLYFEFRSMEELVVRCKRAGGADWSSYDPDEPAVGAGTVGGWSFAREYLQPSSTSTAKYLQEHVKSLEAFKIAGRA